MKCPYCDNEVPANVSTCPSCGAAVQQQAAPQQAAPQQAPQAAAPQVVVQMNNGPAAQQFPPKSRVVYILLALFFGGLGIHNFYAGRTGSGVVQLLITLFTGWLVFPLLIVGIWILIEMIAVTTDGHGQRFA